MSSCPNCNTYNPPVIYKCANCGAIFCYYCRIDWSAILDGRGKCPFCHQFEGYIIKRN